MNEKKVIHPAFDDENLRNLLMENHEREKKIKKLLDAEILKNDQLKMELEIERKKNQVIINGELLSFDLKHKLTQSISIQMLNQTIQKLRRMKAHQKLIKI